MEGIKNVDGAEIWSLVQKVKSGDKEAFMTLTRMHQRKIFIMRHYNQLKNEEIAQALGISPGTVKSLHFKAIRNLRALMGPYLGWET